MVCALDRNRIESHVVFNADGPIVKEFAGVTSTTVLGMLKIPVRGIFRDIRRLAIRMVHRWKLRRILESFRPDLIFVNTISRSEAVDWAMELKQIPLVVYCHEIDGTVMINYPQEWLEKLAQRCDLFLGCSQAVCEFLERCLNIDHERIMTFPASLDLELIQARRLEDAGSVRERLGFSRESFLIGGVGYPNFRKGVDLFIDAASIAVKSRPDLPLCFVWIGGSAELHNQPYTRAMRQLVKKRGIEERFRWVTEVADPFSIMHALSAQVSTAREEPVGLAIVEAMVIGTPVIAFGVGGITELLSDGRGLLVESVSSARMAEAILQFVSNPEDAEEMKQRSHREISAHYDIKKTIVPVVDALEQLVRRNASHQGV
jgi:glycosyltransferase involved in cell wall biosynthesis